MIIYEKIKEKKSLKFLKNLVLIVKYVFKFKIKFLYNKSLFILSLKNQIMYLNFSKIASKKILNIIKEIPRKISKKNKFNFFKNLNIIIKINKKKKFLNKFVKKLKIKSLKLIRKNLNKLNKYGFFIRSSDHIYGFLLKKYKNIFKFFNLFSFKTLNKDDFSRMLFIFIFNYSVIFNKMYQRLFLSIKFKSSNRQKRIQILKKL